jgi:hypothetical protein
MPTETDKGKGHGDRPPILGGSGLGMYSQGMNPMRSQPTRGGGSCFPAGTLIATPIGDLDIATLGSGDLVTAFHERSGTSESRRILRKRLHRGVQLWTMHFDDGSTIRTTRAHSFLVDGAWTKASGIVPGSKIQFITGIRKRCMAVEQHEADHAADVYNLIVESEYTFIADGAIVHSFSYFRRLRKLAWETWSRCRNVGWLLFVDERSAARRHSSTSFVS